MQSEGMDKLLRAAWYAPDVFESLKRKRVLNKQLTITPIKKQ
ncbi:hypothetical protein THIOSC15_80004 [uncultured Thiomicrorhabdus sp.]